MFWATSLIYKGIVSGDLTILRRACWRGIRLSGRLDRLFTVIYIVVLLSLRDRIDVKKSGFVSVDSFFRWNRPLK